MKKGTGLVVARGDRPASAQGYAGWQLRGKPRWRATSPRRRRLRLVRENKTKKSPGNRGTWHPVLISKKFIHIHNDL